MRSIFYSYLIAVLFVIGCSSGQKAYQKGNYYEAVITAVNHLKRNNDHKKSIETLRQAYPMSVQYFEDKISTTIASPAEFKWAAVVQSYVTLNTMYDEIKRCPGALAVIPNPTNYTSKLAEARNNAAEEQYVAGRNAMAMGTREKAKVAYGYFKACGDYVPNYKDAQQKMEEALWAATVKVIMEPIPVTKRFGVSAEFFDSRMSEYLHSASINQFVRFYSPAEAKKLKITPDHIVKVEFDEFVVGQTLMHEKEIPVQKDSIEVGTYSGKPTTGSSFTSGTSGGAVITPVSNNPSGAGTGASQAEQDKIAKEKAEKERLAKEQAERERIAKEKAEKDRIEKERLAREQAEKDKAAKEQAEKDRLAKEQTEKDKTAKEQAEKDRLAKEQVEKDRIAKEQSDKEKAAAEQAEKDRLAKEQAEKEKADKEKAEKEKADKEKVEKEKADKEKAEKEKADKEKAEKEKSEKDSDKVTICHKTGAEYHTLEISRSALQAHLDHGDSEGACDDKKKDDKPGDDKKDEKKEDKKPGSSFLLLQNQTYYAAAGKVTQYGMTLAYADTNKIYSPVKATIYYYKKTTVSKGTVTFKVLDAKTNAVLSVEKIPGEYVWISEWATFNGDERALSKEHIALSKQKEKLPPPAQDMFIEFTKPIFDRVTSKINSFYKNY
jgi:membrane protein involved in colicin uptake